MTHPVSAAGVVIGNEVLSAKVQDQNGAHLIKRLRERGVPLRSLVIVADEIDAIVEAVSHARFSARYVITSGGIGPTHDDVTVRAVALALGRKVVRVGWLEDRIREYYGSSTTREALRLADVPDGSQLLSREGIWYPVIQCEGIYLLPGVPQLFKLQLETVLSRLDTVPIRSRSLYLSLGEAEIANALDQVALAMPHVAIGSYPEWDSSAGYRVKVTVEHQESSPVEEVTRRLLETLPSGSVLRVE